MSERAIRWGILGASLAWTVGLLVVFGAAAVRLQERSS